MAVYRPFHQAFSHPIRDTGHGIPAAGNTKMAAEDPKDLSFVTWPHKMELSVLSTKRVVRINTFT